MHFLVSSVRLAWLKVKCPNLAFSQMPVLDGRYFMQAGLERFLKACRFVVMNSTCDTSLIGQIEI